MKFRYIFVSLFSVIILTGCSDAVVQQDYSLPKTKEIAPIERRVQIPPADNGLPNRQEPADVPLSNDNTYINSRGVEVHSPAYAPSVPAGATAICGDGTYSFSQSNRGTCSHHGGVSEWLD